VLLDVLWDTSAAYSITIFTSHARIITQVEIVSNAPGGTLEYITMHSPVERG